VAGPAFFDLSGHVALVTGGNGGIGLGMASGLAQAGAAVAIWGTNPEKNDRALEALKGHGTSVAAFRCDVGDERQVDAAIADTLATFGKVDSCFANAGVSGRTSAFVDMTLDDFKAVTRVNLEGTFLTLRAAARHLVERGEGGSLVGVASLAAISGQARGEHYAATKGGIVAMVKAIAVELARHGVRANTLLPGWVETDMTEQLFAWPRFEERVKPRMPIGRWGRPEDFAAIAVYLASPASQFQNGDTILLDGGYSVF